MSSRVQDPIPSNREVPRKLADFLRERLTRSNVGGGCAAARYLAGTGHEDELDEILAAVLEHLGTPDLEVPPGFEALHVETTVRVVHPDQPTWSRWRSKVIPGEAR